MKNVLITGATSGIGRELAIQLSSKDYKVALVGRRESLLRSLKQEIGDTAYIKAVDVSDFKKAEKAYTELILEMGGLDMMILNAGVGSSKTLPEWKSEENIIKVNALAFAHGCHFSYKYFLEQGHGQIVGISSVTAFVADHRTTAYCATKHFVRIYLTGYRQKARRANANITVTEIIPGFIWTEMTEKNKGMFWVADTDVAVSQMIRSIEKRKNHAYVTRRWRLIVWFLSIIPQWMWNRI